MTLFAHVKAGGVVNSDYPMKFLLSSLENQATVLNLLSPAVT